jgi:diguanylate cyclase (GGDEF)-like protein/PAS domain S-box-containing protein
MAETTILAVDDEPGIRLLAEAAFGRDGYRVLLASSGDEALALLDTHRPDVILLDILMPGIDGFETCRRIKASPEHRNVPVIVLTGLDDVEAIERAYECGAWDFSSKPINWQILKHRVRYALRASEAFAAERRSSRLSRTIDRSHSEVMTYDAASGIVLSANESARENLGYEERAIIGLPFFSVAHGAAGRTLSSELEDLPAQGQKHLSVILLRRDGTRYPAEGNFLYASDEQPHVVICILQDMSERRRVEAELHRLAHYDDLTKLPNRRMLHEHVRIALARAARSESRCAICMLDLDGFKRVNDTLGHTAGDRLLQEVAERLTGVVRLYDCVARDVAPEGPQLAQLARLGGDEFFVLLTDFTDEADAAKVARRILDEVALPYEVGDAFLTITGSMGIALYPDDGESLDKLMMRADSAMYRAKQNGKDAYAFYTAETGTDTLARLSLETDLRAAIDRGELELHYQPQLDDTLDHIVGVEALVRWRHPTDGLRGPDVFIPIAEESGLIVTLGDYVLREALTQLSTWQPLFGPDFKMSVNVSALQLRQDDFLDKLDALMQEKQVPTGSLVLEITESALMTNAATRLSWFDALKSTGVQIAIDDFGTGYSSLSYLTRFPIDYLKVDRSFVSDLERGREGAAITRAIFRMAEELGIGITVEGVENESQLRIIRGMGHCFIQGWLVSKALPPREMQAFISAYAAGQKGKLGLV